MEDNFDLNTDTELTNALSALETDTTNETIPPQGISSTTESEQKKSAYILIIAVVIMVVISLFLFMRPQKRSAKITPIMIEQMRASAIHPTN